MTLNRELHICEPDDDNTNATFLPSTFHGSPRHLKEIANNALSIVSELGSADKINVVTRSNSL
jgi:hypothetical protein